MIELIGWAAVVLLALSPMPQVLKSHLDGHSDGISQGLLWFWFVGEVFMLLYIVLDIGTKWLLILNCLINLLFCSIIIKYKYWPRERLCKKRERNLMRINLK